AVLGYSVNESVVIMDRIRENFRIQRRMPVGETVDLSITQNILRTIITHVSTQIMVLSMFFFGGPTLKYFSLALTIGIWFRLYSSVVVASVVALMLGRNPENLTHKVTTHDDDPLLGETQEGYRSQAMVRSHPSSYAIALVCPQHLHP